MSIWILCIAPGNKVLNVNEMKRCLIYLLGGIPKEKMRSVFVRSKEKKFGPLGGFFVVPFVTGDDKTEYILLTPYHIRIGREMAKKYLSNE